MAKLLSIITLVAVVSPICLAQVGGGSVYGQGQRDGGALGNERAKRTLTEEEMPPNSTSMFLDASVLINVKADEYVALFGVNFEGATLEECNQKMASTIGRFTDELKQMGVLAKDLDVDFVAQNRIYGYEVAADVAKEKLTGFELKKNVAVHYRDKATLDRLIATAARSQIFDLIKVDYVVKDIDAIHTRLMEAAARVIKLKAANHARLLGIKIRQPQVYAERYANYYPTEMYESYIAAESEDVSSNYYRQKFVVQGARKARTFYFNPLNAKTFDEVVNPIVIEPVVHFTLYLKVKYETGLAGKAKPRKKRAMP